MALIDTSTKRFCFPSLFKRSKSPETLISSNIGQRKVSFDSNNSLPTDCSISKQNGCHLVLCDASSVRRKTSSHSSDKSRQQHDDNEDATPQRASSLLRCFGSRTTRQSSESRRFGARPVLRAKTCEDCVDTADSNLTTRSSAIDIDCQDGSTKALRFREKTSFYSVLGFFDAAGELFETGTESRALLGSPSRYRKDSLFAGDEDSCDFFSIDGDDWDDDSLISATNDVPAEDNNTSTPNEPNGEQEEPSQQLRATLALSADASEARCACGFKGHISTYDPAFPLITAPGIVPDSFEECRAVALSCCGCWETILSRSESLDPQFRCLGLGMVKRAVMNRLAVPLTMFMEDEDRIFHCWIHTPLGVRHMRSNLLHDESIDEDPDAGQWKGVTHIVDYSIPWYCDGKTVRALQQVRHNVKVGTCIETRCILPDKEEGKIMLFSFVMIPKGKQERLSADRILKYTGPKSS